MAWLAKDACEMIFDYCPERGAIFWAEERNDGIELPEGSIKKLIGRDLTWNDEPVEI
jgi:hypothetical protein